MNLSSKKSFTHTDIFLSLFFAAMAFAIRFHSLDTIYFDIDEAFHLWFTTRASLTELFKVLHQSSPQQFPLDYVLNFFVSHQTTDIRKLRMLPVLWGAGSTALIYFLGKRLWNRALGSVAACLLTFSIFHVQISQVFRPYSLVVFLSLITLITFINFLENRGWMWAYMLSIFLFQASYPYALVWIAIGFGFVFYAERSKIKYFLIATSPSLLLLLGWGILNGTSLFHSTTYDYSKAQPSFFFNIQEFLFASGQYITLSAIFYFALFVLGAVSSIRSNSTKSKGFFGLCLIAITFSSVLISIHIAKPFFHPRNAIVILPLFLMFVAGGIITVTVIFEKLYKRTVGVWLPTTLTIVSLPFFYLSYERYIASEEYLSATQTYPINYLRDHIKPEDRIIFSNPNTGATFLYFYDRWAFLDLESIYLSKGGFNLFRFPQDLTADYENIESRVYTLCSMDPSAETITAPDLKKQTSGKTWLIYSSINYFKEPNPFFQVLGIDPKDAKEEYPGVFSLTHY